MSPEFIQRYWLTGFIILAAIMYFFAYAGYRVQQDAKKKGLGKAAVTFWSVSVVFFGLIFLPIYFIFRSRSVFATEVKEEEKQDRYKLCPHCGERNPVDGSLCGKCRKPLDSAISATGSKTCPYCGADNPVEARRCKSCDQVIGYAETDEE